MNTKESDILTEYRALTKGGCVSGSRNFYSDRNNPSTTWTAPTDCTRIMSSNGVYYKVTPGRTYSVQPRNVGKFGLYMGVWVESANYMSGYFIPTSKNNDTGYTFSWGSSIEAHTDYTADMDSYTQGTYMG